MGTSNTGNGDQHAETSKRAENSQQKSDSSDEESSNQNDQKEASKSGDSRGSQQETQSSQTSEDSFGDYSKQKTQRSDYASQKEDQDSQTISQNAGSEQANNSQQESDSDSSMSGDKPADKDSGESQQSQQTEKKDDYSQEKTTSSSKSEDSSSRRDSGMAKQSQQTEQKEQSKTQEENGSQNESKKSESYGGENSDVEKDTYFQTKSDKQDTKDDDSKAQESNESQKSGNSEEQYSKTQNDSGLLLQSENQAPPGEENSIAGDQTNGKSSSSDNENAKSPQKQSDEQMSKSSDEKTSKEPQEVTEQSAQPVPTRWIPKNYLYRVAKPLTIAPAHYWYLYSYTNSEGAYHEIFIEKNFAEGTDEEYEYDFAYSVVPEYYLVHNHAGTKWDLSEDGKNGKIVERRGLEKRGGVTPEAFKIVNKNGEGLQHLTWKIDADEDSKFSEGRIEEMKKRRENKKDEYVPLRFRLHDVVAKSQQKKNQAQKEQKLEKRDEADQEEEQDAEVFVDALEIQPTEPASDPQVAQRLTFRDGVDENVKTVEVFLSKLAEDKTTKASKLISKPRNRFTGMFSRFAPIDKLHPRSVPEETEEGPDEYYANLFNDASFRDAIAMIVYGEGAELEAGSAKDGSGKELMWRKTEDGFQIFIHDPNAPDSAEAPRKVQIHPRDFNNMEEYTEPVAEEDEKIEQATEKLEEKFFGKKKGFFGGLEEKFGGAFGWNPTKGAALTMGRKKADGEKAKEEINVRFEESD